MKENYPNFLLTGTYSSFNKGDAAMQLATAESLRAEWPQSEITISAPFPHYDRTIYRDFRIIRSNRRKLVYSTISLFCAYIYSAFSRFGITVPFLLWNGELREIKRSSLVIDLSGDTITEDYGPHVTYSHLLPLLLAQALKTPTYICAQSMGPFTTTKGLVKKVLSRCEYVTAREKVTYEYLHSIGIPKNKLLLESDMAFLLKPCDEKTVDKILKKEKISITKPTIGITVSEIIRSRYNSQSNDDFDVFFARLVERIIEKLDVNVLFLGHVTGPSKIKDDRVIARRIVENLEKHKKRVFIINGDHSPKELKGIISRCSLFLGARMHSNIGAVSTHVPTVAMSYSHKTIGIMRSVGLGDYVIPGDKLTEDGLLDYLEKIAVRKVEIKKQLEQTIPNIQKSSQNNIETIRKILETRRQHDR